MNWLNSRRILIPQHYQLVHTLPIKRYGFKDKSKYNGDRLEKKNVVDKIIADTEQIILTCMSNKNNQEETIKILKDQIDLIEETAQRFSMYELKFKKTLPKPLNSFIRKTQHIINMMNNLGTFNDFESYAIESLYQLQRLTNEINDFIVPNSEEVGPYEDISFDKLESNISQTSESFKNYLEILKSREETINNMLKDSDQLLTESELFLGGLNTIKDTLSGTTTNDVYWIYMVDLLSQCLSLLGIATNDSLLTVKTGNGIRFVLSLIVFIVSIFYTGEILSTGLFFGIFYLLITWLVSLVNLLSNIKNLTYNDKKEYYSLGFAIVTILFITVFGIKQYLSGGGNKIIQGSMNISSGYLMGIGGLGILSSGFNLMYPIKTNEENTGGDVSSNINTSTTNLRDLRNLSLDDEKVLYKDDNVCIFKPNSNEGIVIYYPYDGDKSKYICKNGLIRNDQNEPIYFKAPYEFSQDVNTNTNNVMDEIKKSYGDVPKHGIFIRVCPERTFVYSSEIRLLPDGDTRINESKKTLKEYLNVIENNAKTNTLPTGYKKMWNLYTSEIVIVPNETNDDDTFNSIPIERSSEVIVNIDIPPSYFVQCV
jgi:hypothetical protein